MQSVTAAVDKSLPSGKYISDSFCITSKHHRATLIRHQVLHTYSILRKISRTSLMSLKSILMELYERSYRNNELFY